MSARSERSSDIGLRLVEQIGEEGVTRVVVYPVLGVQEAECRSRDHGLLDRTRGNAPRSGEISVGVRLVAETPLSQSWELAGVTVCERDHNTIRREPGKPMDRVGSKAWLPLLPVGDHG